MEIRALFVKHCAFCDEERPVERPECLDGHGDDCPEAFCALCGLAIWGGPPVMAGQGAPSGDMARWEESLGRMAPSLRA